MAAASEVKVRIAEAQDAGGQIAVLDQIVTQKNSVEMLAISDPRFDGAPALPVATVPAGRALQSVRPLLDEYLDHPTRRRGEATVLSPKAFIDLVTRLKGASSVVFANPDEKAPSLTAVLNYHPEGSTEDVEAGEKHAGWGDHRVKLACRMSDEWDAWLDAHNNENGFSQPDFAAFLQDRISDCIIVDTGQEPKIAEVVELLQARLGSPQALMTLARGLEVRQNQTVKNAQNLDDGSAQISYVNEVSENAGPVTVPTLFFITIPVFYGGAPYRIPVRLRFRVRGPAIVWFLHLYRIDKVFEDAFSELMKDVGSKLDLPIFLGSPEK